MKKVICNENHFQNCCYDYRKGESMKEFGYEKQYDVIVAGGGDIQALTLKLGI